MCGSHLRLVVKLNDIDETLKEVESLLSQEKNLSPTFHAMIKLLITMLKLSSDRMGLNSRNSSKPPSSDPNRLKSTRKKSAKKTGGQPGHVGTTLKQIDEPDEVEEIVIDRRTLPKGHRYEEVGTERRQVFELFIAKNVIEYQAQILQDENGQQFVAPFPEGVTKAVQYGNSIKAHAVYMSQHQLLPYNRIEEYFKEQLGIPVSQGSLYNFNKEAFTNLTEFDQIAKDALALSNLVHADETGVNIGGKRHWLHCASNPLWTHFFAHEKRGVEAMDAINIIPRFKGILCHDHWKPYYHYDGCLHALCNAHHLRELTRACEQDDQIWAGRMKALLEDINADVHDAGDCLNKENAQEHRNYYREILKQADIECPPPDETRKKGQRGRIKRSKARNLLERLRNFEEDVLRFMAQPDVPFTNNLGERDIRMTKVQQKISGCFRSQEGSEIFCRVRGYLSTCRKHGVTSSHAMEMIFDKKLPDFIS